ncbi:MAG: hypothetical protein Q9170_005067 [Blastenia crenularia]
MSKRSITDFFKPFAFPREPKQPSLDGEVETRPAQRSRSTTFQVALPPATEQALSLVDPNNARLISSQSSVLSSLPDPTQSTPANSIDQHPTPPTARPGKSAPTRSFTEEVSASQAPIISSSQRTIRNGEVVIRDSDDERSDTDISLEDPDDLIASRRPPLQSISSSDEELPSLPSLVPTRSNASYHAMKGKSKPANTTVNQRPTPAVIPKFKFSLDALIKQRQIDDSSRLSVENAKFLLDSLEEQKPAALHAGSPALDEELLATVVRNDDERGDMDKLAGAIKRTEALDQPKRWQFFREEDEIGNAGPPKRPAVTDPYWKSVFEDHTSWQQAFLSGHVGELASFRKLPNEILHWLLDAACHETRDDLCHSYCQALRVGEPTLYTTTSSRITVQDIPDQIGGCLDISKCNELFRCIGANSESLDLEKVAAPMTITSNGNWQTILRRVVGLPLSSFTGLRSRKAKTDLGPLGGSNRFDEPGNRELARDCTVLSKIEDTMSAIVDRMNEGDLDRELTAGLIPIYHSVKDSGLRLQLLRHLPASSVRLSLLRRRLALAFFFKDRTYLSKDRERLVNFRVITHRLNSPRFVIDNETDYPGLAAEVAILAIGLDNGDPPPIDAGKAAVVTFNECIDFLASRIKAMFTQIIDTGASHMKRTEAKEVLESFHSYLVYAVRTTQKPKGMMWGSESVTGKQKDMINVFAQQGRLAWDLDTDR